MSHVLLLLTQLFIFSIFSRQTRSSSSGTPPDYTMKPVYQTSPPDNQITSQIRPLHTNTTTDHRPDPTTKLDHQITPPPPIQTTSSDHPNRPQDTIFDYSASNQHSIPSLLKWYRSGAFFVGLARGGYIELWMNLAKHTFHTRSA